MAHSGMSSDFSLYETKQDVTSLNTTDYKPASLCAGEQHGQVEFHPEKISVSAESRRGKIIT